MRPTSLSAAVFLFCSSLASAQISIQRIAFRGDAVQSALFPNQTISYAGIPLINDAGEVVFESSLTPDTGGGTGAVLANSSGLHMVVQRGAPAPGTGGATFDVIGFAPSLNIAGQIGVFGSLEGTGVNEGNRLGSWAGAAGSVQLVMRTGAAAPQYSGATFESTGRPRTGEINGQLGDSRSLQHHLGANFDPELLANPYGCLHAK